MINVVSQRFNCEITSLFICIKDATRKLVFRCAEVYVDFHDYPYSKVESFMIEKWKDQSSYLKILFFDALEDNDDGDDDDN